MRWGRRASASALLRARATPPTLAGEPASGLGSTAGLAAGAGATARGPLPPWPPLPPKVLAPPAAAARLFRPSFCFAFARTSFTPHALHSVLGPAAVTPQALHSASLYAPLSQSNVTRTHRHPNPIHNVRMTQAETRTVRPLSPLRRARGPALRTRLGPGTAEAWQHSSINARLCAGMALRQGRQRR